MMWNFDLQNTLSGIFLEYNRSFWMLELKIIWDEAPAWLCSKWEFHPELKIQFTMEAQTISGPGNLVSFHRSAL